MSLFRRALALLLLLTLLTSCQRARRYPQIGTTQSDVAGEKHEAEVAKNRLLWIEPATEFRDIPIHYVTDAAAEWDRLPGFWNLSPPPGAGMATIHIGTAPLAAYAGILAADHLQIIKIKVPRGLPEPTPFMPPDNPPSYARWRLGKQLFFDAVLQLSDRNLACASCHQPGHGFTQDTARGKDGESRNTLSLINCVYNRSQFWDGRVATLEETIARAGGGTDVAGHNWGGIAKTLADTPALKAKYGPGFREVFGVAAPTQDAVAKALATYMRTILSGDSIMDRAEHEQRRLKDAALSATHIAAVLDARALAELDRKTAATAARELEYGRDLFHGKAGCFHCHHGPLYTDGDFHNIGLDDNDASQLGGKNLGRFEHVPIGLKAKRLIGAYRTPTLRALPRTPRYMHDGKFATLPDVLNFYNQRIDATHNRYVSEVLLKHLGPAQRLHLGREALDALALYLQALDGGQVDAVVAAP